MQLELFSPDRRPLGEGAELVMRPDFGRGRAVFGEAMALWPEAEEVGEGSAAVERVPAGGRSGCGCGAREAPAGPRLRDLPAVQAPGRRLGGRSASVVRVLAAWVLAAAAAAAGPAPCPGTGVEAVLDIPYRTVQGVDPALLSLDLYRPVVEEGCPAAPVLVWVHGGAWAAGDKRNAIEQKVTLFTRLGWVLVSVNYRLSPAELPEDPTGFDPARVTYPVHEEDVAAAVAWVRANVAGFGGDPGRISLMGHSAGAHMVSLLGTDPSFLAAHEMGLADIAQVVSLDTAAYDLERRIAGASPHGALFYLNAFGADPAAWAAASPIRHVAAGSCLPPFLVVTRGQPARVEQARRFAAALWAAGGHALLLETPQLTHRGVNLAVGDPGDTTLTPVLVSFLETRWPPRPPCPGPRGPHGPSPGRLRDR